LSTDIPRGFRPEDTTPQSPIPDEDLPDCRCGETIRRAEPVTSQCAQVHPCGCYLPQRRFEPRRREATDLEVREAVQEVDSR
jgi:hypothetical protein